MFLNNLILSVDSYKASHSFQLDPEITQSYSYIESRGGRHDKVLFFGLQKFLDEISGEVITTEHVAAAERFYAEHGVPFDSVPWMIIVTELGGRLPIEIHALAEGTVAPVGTPLVTIENTDPRFPWLPAFLETALLRAVWYPTTVATTSFHARLRIDKALHLTADDPENKALFMLHDFGARGASSSESAAIGGCAHLTVFRGSDTVEGIMCARQHYNHRMAGFSIPAAEHSTITSWGRDHEHAAYLNMIQQFGQTGAKFSVVSDSYDLINAVANIWGEDLRKDVLESGATLIVRPDSGDPMTIPIEVIEMLGKKFGYTVNSKGYKVLHPSVRVIQGDGITVETLPQILGNLVGAGWSAENLAFGMGGGLLQQVNRDTQRFAQKCSAVKTASGWRDAYKAPKTDPGKNSKRGRLAVYNEALTGMLQTVRKEELANPEDDQLLLVFCDGDIERRYGLQQIRDTVEAELDFHRELELIAERHKAILNTSV